VSQLEVSVVYTAVLFTFKMVSLNSSGYLTPPHLVEGCELNGRYAF